MNFIVYDNTGSILQVGTCPEDQLSIQGDLVIEGVGSALTHEVINGEVVPYDEATRELRATSPSRYHNWDNLTHTWQDCRDFGTLKTAKWEELKVQRLNRETAPLSYLGTTFDADFASQAKITGAVTLALMSGSLVTMDWTDAENNTVTLTKAELLGLGAALGQRTSDIYSQARTLRAQVEAATTIEELAINWA